MKILSEYFNSGSLKQQNMKRLGGLLVSITAALLVIVLLILAVSGFATAMKNKNPETPDDSSDDTGTTITNGYTTTTFDATQLSKGNLILVDASHPYTGTPSVTAFANSRPKTTDGDYIYWVYDTQKFALTEETAAALNEMMQAFYEENQDDSLWVAQAYDTTSGENQATYYHTTGTTITLKYGDKAADLASIYGVEKYDWIYNNADQYGFIRVSSAEGEENIFRYIGKEHAAAMKRVSKTTLADYLEVLQTRYNKPTSAITVSVNSVSYRIYYQAASETPLVPTKWKYTVSGDNMNGYIITVNTSTSNK